MHPGGRVKNRGYRPRAPGVVSRNMSAIRSQDTVAEVLLRRTLHRHGLRFRKNVRSLAGTPDIVIRRARVALFVDGDFWHGRTILRDGVAAFRRAMKNPRREWWLKKLMRTIERDRRVNVSLRQQGWTVIRVWESAVKRNPEAVYRRVVLKVGKRV